MFKKPWLRLLIVIACAAVVTFAGTRIVAFAVRNNNMVIYSVDANWLRYHFTLRAPDSAATATQRKNDAPVVYFVPKSDFIDVEIHLADLSGAPLPTTDSSSDGSAVTLTLHKGYFEIGSVVGTYSTDDGSIAASVTPGAIYYFTADATGLKQDTALSMSIMSTTTDDEVIYR